ncbi:MAG: hypothetical protein M0P57_12775 [Syntrophales bacterium]|jgi:hypothetical protein|nr:hypothetical protein [Syntrophales bacterium]MDY0043961.1 hypothetical protein [Syntrophales bacterium]
MPPSWTALFNDSWKKLNPCDVLLVRGDGDCGYVYKGKAYAPLIDSIGDLGIMRNLVIESVAIPYSKLIGQSAYSSPVSYNRSALFVGLIRRIIWFIRGRAKGESWANNQRMHIWDLILKKTDPKCVIGIQPDVGLCRAGRIHDIPVFDLQHGVIDDGNPWYSEKYRSETPEKDLPSGFLCWDESSAAILRKWAPQKGINVEVVGNPWFVRFLIENPDDSLVREIIHTERIFNNHKPVILVSLQWGLDFYYKNDTFNGVMVDALEKVILETADSYNWLLRLHPVQLRAIKKEEIRNYLENTFGHLSSVEWGTCSELPLPVLLRQVDLHITDMSSIVVEAGWMGIYSALLNSNIRCGGSLQHMFMYERETGLAQVLPQDRSIVMQWIEKTLIKGKRNVSLNNMEKALSSFINYISSTVEAKRK